MRTKHLRLDDNFFAISADSIRSHGEMNNPHNTRTWNHRLTAMAAAFAIVFASLGGLAAAAETQSQLLDRGLNPHPVELMSPRHPLHNVLSSVFMM